MQNKVVLCIIDGWGVNSKSENNGTIVASNWHKLLNKYPHTQLQASEKFVGLPKSQMGNSEVGHAAIGLGRIQLQDLPKIDKAFMDGTISNHPKFIEAVKYMKQTSSAFHVMGLLSPGGIHSHMNHMRDACLSLAAKGIHVFVHVFLDGRDTPPSSSILHLDEFINSIKSQYIEIASISGRYYAMDRDNRFERTAKAYDAIINGNAPKFTSPIDAIKSSYQSNITDEFFIPMVAENYRGVKNGDGLWMINFRADRVRQILKSMLLEDFTDFSRSNSPVFGPRLAMNEYADFLNPYITSMFYKETVINGLGEVISINNLKQLRIAETEKYAHVTFFFNGGVEQPFPNEERILIPSPKVATYDLQPEMSAQQVTKEVINAMKRDDLNLIVVNFANTDMVGHTGVIEAIKKAVICVDDCVNQITKQAIDNNWVLLITSDHGNVEFMCEDDGSAHTAHTCNPVPLVIVNYKHKYNLTPGNLSDIAPTILQILDIKKPQEMTGKSLLC